MPTANPKVPRKDQDNLARTLQHHGLYHPSVGIAAIRLLQQLQQQPMSHEERVRTSTKKAGASSMGVLIRAGLATYIAESRVYIITGKGANWLRSLHEKNLMPKPQPQEAA